MVLSCAGASRPSTQAFQRATSKRHCMQPKIEPAAVGQPLPTTLVKSIDSQAAHQTFETRFPHTSCQRVRLWRLLVKKTIANPTNKVCKTTMDIRLPNNESIIVIRKWNIGGSIKLPFKYREVSG